MLKARLSALSSRVVPAEASDTVRVYNHVINADLFASVMGSSKLP